MCVLWLTDRGKIEDFIKHRPETKLQAEIVGPVGGGRAPASPPLNPIETSWNRQVNTETCPDTAENPETFMDTSEKRFGDVSLAFPFPCRSQTGTRAF